MLAVLAVLAGTLLVHSLGRLLILKETSGEIEGLAVTVIQLVAALCSTAVFRPETVWGFQNPKGLRVALVGFCPNCLMQRVEDYSSHSQSG